MVNCESRRHPQHTATQLMFVRTLRKAVMQKAEISSLDGLRQAPLNSIGDPEQLFVKVELSDLIAMIQHLAASTIPASSSPSPAPPSGCRKMWLRQSGLGDSQLARRCLAGGIRTKWKRPRQIRPKAVGIRRRGSGKKRKSRASVIQGSCATAACSIGSIPGFAGQ